LECIHFLNQFAKALVSRIPIGIVRTITPALFWGGIFGVIIFVAYFLIGSIFVIPAIVALPGIIWLWKQSYRPDRELIKLEKRASSGEPEAMYELGMMYRNGSAHFPKDIPEARYWLLKAAEAGHSEAMLQISQLMAWGHGGQKDQTQARQWLQRAKEMGLNEANIYLGRMDENSE
jgi:hypothetical protein